MAASSTSASLGDGAETRTTSLKSEEAPNEDKVHNDNAESHIKKVDEPPKAPDDSLLATPKTSPSKRISEGGKADDIHSDGTESAMNYTPSPTSDLEKSLPSSPQTSLNQPLVSHVPAAVQQPKLQSEHSSLASPAATIVPQQIHEDVDNTTVQQQQQQQQQHLQQPAIEEKFSAVPTLVIHGTRGQVVMKRKGRFRLLQDPDTAAAPNLGGDIHATVPQSTENISVSNGIEAPVSGAHPTRERTLSNTSTISAMSVPAAAPPPPPPAPVVPNALNVVDSPSHPHTVVGKKKGRFVVIPGDVTDPSLLRQPFSGNQGVLQQQPLQPTVAAVTEQVLVSTPQAATMVVPQAAVVVTQQPIMSSQDVTQQQAFQGGEASQQQLPQNIPQHQIPQYYTSSPHATFGHTPQVMQVSYAQQHQVGPPVAGAAAPAQMQARNSHSPVPPAAQQSYQQVLQPPAQILVTEQPMTQPTYMVQTDDGRFHQMVAAPQQQMVSIPEQQQSAVSGFPSQQQTAGLTQDLQQQIQHTTGPVPFPSQQQTTSLTQDPQQQIQNTTAQVPPTAESLKPPQVVKPVAAKRSGIQRGPSGSKVGPANVGFGKVFYFLEQMKLEVTEADRTIKNQGRDMKFLREKNKELEARSRDMERKWLEEKAAREALETKVKSLKKKIKELRAPHDATEGEKKTKDAHQNATESSRSQSRSNSIDDAERTGEKGAPIATVDETKPNSSGVVSLSASSKSKEVEGTTEEKSVKQPTSSSVDVSSTQPKPCVISKPSVTPAPAIPMASKDTNASLPSMVKGKLAQEGTKSTQKEFPKADSGASEALPAAPNDNLSPFGKRGSQEARANELASAKSQSATSLTAPTIDGTTGEVISKPIVSSSVDSLGSGSDFDPLRVTHAPNGDGATATPSAEPISGGHPGSSVVSFVTAQAPIQTITFDPLSSGFQTGSVTVPAGMQPSPQHNHSQSMPNFIVQPNSMMMAYPLQQVQNSSRSLSYTQLPQGWQQQQPLPGQNQYLPTQYADMTASNLQPQQPYLHSQVSAAQQQQQQQQQQHAPTTNAPSADPFDELASRRAPGTTN